MVRLIVEQLVLLIFLDCERTKADGYQFTSASVTGRFPDLFSSQIKSALLDNSVTCICTLSLVVPYQTPHEYFFEIILQIYFRVVSLATLGNSLENSSEVQPFPSWEVSAVG